MVDIQIEDFAEKKLKIKKGKEKKIDAYLTLAITGMLDCGSVKSTTEASILIYCDLKL